MQPNPFNTEHVKPQQQPILVEQDNPYADVQPSPSPMMAQFEVQKEPGPLDHLSDGLEGQARTAFIGKVYILLTSK